MGGTENTGLGASTPTLPRADSTGFTCRTLGAGKSVSAGFSSGVSRISDALEEEVVERAGVDSPRADSAGADPEDTDKPTHARIQTASHRARHLRHGGLPDVGFT